MAIVSSTSIVEGAQHDGRFWVQENHTDQVGVVYVVRYLAVAGADTNAVMTARAIQISDQITTAEIVMRRPTMPKMERKRPEIAKR